MFYLTFIIGVALMAIAPQLTHASGPGLQQRSPSASSTASTGRPSKSVFNLRPTQAPGHDYSNPDHINPSHQQILYFSGAHEPEHMHANTHVSVLYNLHHPSVPLEHIDSIKNVQCPEDGIITFSFSQPNLFQQARNSWPKNGDDFILIDNTDGCGKSAHRTFFYVDEYVMNEKTHSVWAKGEMLSGTEARIIQSYTANWGHNRAPDPHSSQRKLKQRLWEPAKSAIERRWGFNPIGDISSAVGKVSTAAAPVVSSAKAGVSSAVAAVSTGAAHVGSAVESKASQVETGASHLVQSAKTEASKIATKASDIAEQVVSHLPTAAVHKDFEDNIDHEADKGDDSPWGKAFEIGSVKGMTVYCVDCGVKGKLSMSGSISVHPAKGKDMFQAGSVDIELQDFSVSVIFGFKAKGFNTPRIPIPLKKGVLALPLDPFSIPDVFVIGPQVDYKVELLIALSATGNLKTGLSMNWKDAKAHLDLKSQSNKVGGSGWKPDVKKTFELSDGKISMNASLATPLSFGCGINILNSLVDIQAEVAAIPSIELDSIAKSDGNTKRDYTYNDRSHARELVPSELQVRDDDKQCKKGILQKLSFVDRINLQVVPVYHYPLTSTSESLWQTCEPTAASDKLGHQLAAVTGPGPTAGSVAASIPHPSGAFPKFSANGTAAAGATGGTGTAPKTTKPPTTSS